MNIKSVESDYVFVKGCRENPHQLTHMLGTVGVVVVILCTIATMLTVLSSVIVIVQLVHGSTGPLRYLTDGSLLFLAICLLGASVVFVSKVFRAFYNYYNFEAYEARILPLIRAGSMPGNNNYGVDNR